MTEKILLVGAGLCYLGAIYCFVRGIMLRVQIKRDARERLAYMRGHLQELVDEKGPEVVQWEFDWVKRRAGE